MPIKIAIVDDQMNDADFVRKRVDTWSFNRGVSAKIQLFASAEAFLFCYSEDKSWDVLLLDIEMAKMDGISLANLLRQENKSVQIVFITGFPDYVSMGYDVSALHYLLKPICQEKLSAVLDRALAAVTKKERVILLSVGGEMLRVPVDKIQYVEAFSHTVAVDTGTDIIQVKMPISELEKKLGDRFVRCHRSYLVGLKHISRLSKTEVILDSGKILPLSRNAAPLVHKAFISYYTGDLDENI